jgi:hypothetical protein
MDAKSCIRITIVRLGVLHIDHVTIYMADKQRASKVRIENECEHERRQAIKVIRYNYMCKAKTEKIEQRTKWQGLRSRPGSLMSQGLGFEVAERSPVTKRASQLPLPAIQLIRQVLKIL